MLSDASLGAYQMIPSAPPVLNPPRTGWWRPVASSAALARARPVDQRHQEVRTVPGAYQRTSSRPSPSRSARTGWYVPETEALVRANAAPGAPHHTASPAEPGAYQKM